MITISEASKLLGVTPKTLRLWEKQGKISSFKTDGGHRRYDLTNLNNNNDNKDKITIAYARVSSVGQKNDLKRQQEILESYCAAKGFSFQLISDIGSGLNYKKKGLKDLIKLIISNKISRLILTHKDRLLRFGSELIFSLCENFNVEVIIINQSIENTYEEDLTQDVLEIITVFSAKLYGSRSHKNKQILKQLQAVVKTL